MSRKFPSARSLVIWENFSFHLCFFARCLVNFWASGMGSFVIANNNVNEPYLLKLQSREMDLTKIRLIQKVFIKERGAEISRKFRTPLSL
jgi:hypothetical protein